MNLLVFPHQLFAKHPGFSRGPTQVVLIEDSLFFGDDYYPMKFHKQKLWLHRATMKRFEAKVQEDGYATLYLDYDPRPDSLHRHLKTVVDGMKAGPRKLLVSEPSDFILEKRILRACRRLDVEIEFLSNPGFINHPQENQEYRAGKKRWFMADFYKFQRRRMDILMDGEEPVGGKWSYDEDNRKKVPKKMLADIPARQKVRHDEVDHAAKEHVERSFPDNPGSVDQLFYPTSHAAALRWLKSFLKFRMENFGPYEDAIVEGESWLWHSVLTPALNTGLLTPRQVVDETIKFSNKNEVPISSLEGFLRQIIGWREFIRATYQDLGVAMRTTNHWAHDRKMPNCFYDGTTGIAPLDDTIQRVLRTGYCHHIERLMVLGGFMFLCEIDPDDIYQWFMEMFIDSYDWVMVPNAYAMSQNADGGLITTKPYFSGSSYIRKMSHYKVGPWCEIWDGLYWRWILNHADELAKNPRWAMMCSMARKMDKSKQKQHLANANRFLKSL